ncbi:MAG TPA: 30S ribosomal protein S20 [Parcubacteria group bacterium]|jgi:small subunit ribosomal protein S20|nr:30S ribosomal protein S20 [Parcubacteria group bacterium]
MPITKSAKKALRNSGKKRVFNLRKKDAINKAVKNLKALVSKKDIKGAVEYMKNVQKVLDKSVKTGLIKLNTASRKKSRLVAMIKKAQ